MKATNNYISLPHALNLIQSGWIFRQDLKQTEFKVLKGVGAIEYHKLNKTTATELKKHLNALRNQINIKL